MCSEEWNKLSAEQKDRFTFNKETQAEINTRGLMDSFNALRFLVLHKKLPTDIELEELKQKEVATGAENDKSKSPSGGSQQSYMSNYE